MSNPGFTHDVFLSHSANHQPSAINHQPDWGQLQAGTFRFRIPLNQDHRFMPLRRDDALIKGSLAQFLFIDWRDEEAAHVVLSEFHSPTKQLPA